MTNPDNSLEPERDGISVRLHTRSCRVGVEGGDLRPSPLACIWFADEMGSYIGPTSSGAITSSAPGRLVCIAGWLLLLMPVLVAIGYAIWG
jgi:hypothetical protein